MLPDRRTSLETVQLVIELPGAITHRLVNVFGRPDQKIEFELVMKHRAVICVATWPYKLLLIDAEEFRVLTELSFWVESAGRCNMIAGIVAYDQKIWILLAGHNRLLECSMGECVLGEDYHGADPQVGRIRGVRDTLIPDSGRLIGLTAGAGRLFVLDAHGQSASEPWL